MEKDKLLKVLHDMDMDLPMDALEGKINNGYITNIKDLLKEIGTLTKNENIFKSYKRFLNEALLNESLRNKAIMYDDYDQMMKVIMKLYEIGEKTYKSKEQYGRSKKLMKFFYFHNGDQCFVRSEDEEKIESLGLERMSFDDFMKSGSLKYKKKPGDPKLDPYGEEDWGWNVQEKTINENIKEYNGWIYFKFETQEDINDFLNYLEKLGYIWKSGIKPTENIPNVSSNDCLRINIVNKYILGTAQERADNGSQKLYNKCIKLKDFINNAEFIEQRRIEMWKKKEEIRLMNLDRDPYGEEDWLDENLNSDNTYTVVKFWYKYLNEKREAIRNQLKGKEIEFHTNTKNVGLYKGRICGLLPALSKKRNQIIILFDTKRYGVLEVNNDHPIIIRDPNIREGVKWYNDGKFSEEEGKDDTALDFKIGDIVERKGLINYWDDSKNSKMNIKDTSISNPGKWDGSYKFDKRVVMAVDYADNVKGYTGTIVQLEGSWPWFQTTNMEKVEDKKKKEMDLNYIEKLADPSIEPGQEYVIDYLGDRIKVSDAQWCEYDKEWCRKEDAIWINYMRFYTTPEAGIDPNHRGELKEGKVKWYGAGDLSDDEEVDVNEYNDFIISDEFRNFLIKNKAYDTYINYINSKVMNDFPKYWHNQKKGLDLIDKSLSFSSTPEGGSFWQNLNTKWREYYNKNIRGTLEEGIKWYKKGEFGNEQPSEFKEYEYSIGDIVRSNRDRVFYWRDKTTQDTDKTSVYNSGEWIPHQTSDSWTIVDISHCNDVQGYSGTIIRVKEVWPWLQITNFKLAE
jgi:hypothetical protein